jgi:GNAT superfamily N-acetyltransferase
VRALEPDDWQVYREIRLAMLADSPEAFASRYEDVVRRDETEWRRVLTDCDHFLAEQDGATVGGAGLVEHEGELNLIGMYVVPDHRGGPAATLLVAAVADRARARGGRRVLLDVVIGNDRARRFYERCGFVPTGRTQVVPGRVSALEVQLALAL